MPRNARITAVGLGAPPATATLLRDTLLSGACGASSIPALQGRGMHLMCRKPQSAVFLCLRLPTHAPTQGRSWPPPPRVVFAPCVGPTFKGSLSPSVPSDTSLGGSAVFRVLCWCCGVGKIEAGPPFPSDGSHAFWACCWVLCAGTAFQKLPLTRADGQQEQRDHVRASAQARKHG